MISCEPHPPCQDSKMLGAIHSTKNSTIFETETNGAVISWENFQKIRKLLNFRKAKSEPFNRKFMNFREESKMERNFPVRNFREISIYLWYTSQGCPLFGTFRKMLFHSSLKISGKSTQNFFIEWKAFKCKKAEQSGLLLNRPKPALMKYVAGARKHLRGFLKLSSAYFSIAF